MLKVLVTGSSGFIGKHLIYRLSSLGYNVDTLNRSNDRQRHVNKLFVWSDLEAIDFASYDALIHLTGVAHDTKGSNDLELYKRGNVELLSELLNRCEKGSAKKLILMSTIKVFGSEITHITDEKVMPKPSTVYGQTKLEAEQLFECNQQIQSKKYILRPTLVFGRPFKGNLRTIEKLLAKGFPLPLYALNNRRSYLSIDNLIYVIERIIQGSSILPGVYHLSDDETLSTYEIANVVAKKAGLRLSPIKIPYHILYILAQIGELRGKGFDLLSYEKVTTDLVVYNKKIKRALGINEMPYNLTVR